MNTLNITFNDKIPPHCVHLTDLDQYDWVLAGKLNHLGSISDIAGTFLQPVKQPYWLLTQTSHLPTATADKVVSARTLPVTFKWYQD
jgi:hypothetical protein